MLTKSQNFHSNLSNAIFANGSNGFAGMVPGMDCRKALRASEEGRGRAGVWGWLAKIAKHFTEIGVRLTRKRVFDYFLVVNLKQFIQRDTFLASNAARLTRAQHLEVLWTFSPGAAVMPLPQFLKFDSFLALSVSHWSRERRLEELWVFLRWPPRSAAPNRPPDRPVPDEHPGRFQFRLVGGWEN